MDSPRTADPDLLSAWFRRVVRSDEAAFEALFRTLHPGLLRAATRITGDEATGRDLVQEAFLRFWERRERHDPSGSVRALLHRIVRNLALNHLRDGARRMRLLQLRFRTERPEALSTPFLPEDASPDAARLHRWIEELPDRQREALLLSRFEEMTHEEVASVMGVSPRTVNNHIVRALRTLRERAGAPSAP